MTIFIDTRLRTFAAGIGMLIAVLAVPCAHASVLTYSFTGIAGPGSSISVGAGTVDISGIAFTASGQTVNDVDQFSGGAVGDGRGFFAATTTYAFGAFGSFITNIGGDFYGQNCSGIAAVNCALLSDLGASVGFRIDFAPGVLGDPDFGIALGTQSATGFQINTRTQLNASGDFLTIATGGQILSVTANASDVPEPMTLVLVGFGLAGIGITRRRRVI